MAYAIENVRTSLCARRLSEYSDRLLVLLFAVGYIAMPLVGELSLDALRLVVAVVFLFGAVYVVITIGLIGRIIRELSD